ncbi:MAG TPA: hypothetical protein VMS14_10130 [Ilumatobacteraceae bacterium]|nr:hypothetical protein [Ilumatobacteraceae bacterium]HUC33752.1 hypothetical protein [Ilumatobacteraceae bacterium]
MTAAQLAMANAGFVIGSYVVALGGIGLYTWRMLARARRVARDVPVEDRPWT